MKREKTPDYSIVIRIQNHEEKLVPIYAGTVEVLQANGFDFEIVFVNDASTDGSAALLNQITAVDSRVVTVELRRASGAAAALAAGLEFARGVVLLSVDAEREYNPADLLVLIEKIHRGFDVVSAWRTERGRALALRQIRSRLAQWTLRRLSGVPLHDFGMHLKAFRRDAARQESRFGERHPLLPVLCDWPSARIAEILLSDSEHHTADRHRSTEQTLGLLADLIMARFLRRYRAWPLRPLAMVGLMCFAVGLASFGLLLWEQLAGHSGGADPSPLLLASGMALLAGIQLVAAGLIGELFSRLCFGGRERHIYSVARVIGRSRKAGIV